MKLEIQNALIPGTLMDKYKMGNVTGLEFLNKIFYITDGIMLSQIREICGIDGSTLQNWTKRGWVSNARNKRYNIDQLARILIINMMRDSMQLERIAQLLTYVNGRAGDVSDDIIPESELFDYLCRVIDELVCEEISPDSDNVHELVRKTLTAYEERTTGARRRLENACEIIIFAYYATLVRQKANSLFDKVFGKSVFYN
jgi:DNA-binding transcriptional MerR regulator